MKACWWTCIASTTTDFVRSLRCKQMFVCVYVCMHMHFIYMYCKHLCVLLWLTIALTNFCIMYVHVRHLLWLILSTTTLLPLLSLCYGLARGCMLVTNEATISDNAGTYKFIYIWKLCNAQLIKYAVLLPPLFHKLQGGSEIGLICMLDGVYEISYCILFWYY